MRGWAPGRPPWAWWGAAGDCCQEGPGLGEAQGPTSPSVLWARAWAQGRLSPRGRESFGLKCWGGGVLPPAHHDAKSERGIVCVWMHGRCVCTPVFLGGRDH